MDLSHIADFVSARGKPAVVSLSEDTHIFHFASNGDWEMEPLLFVNRNGHQFRLIEQPNGDYLFAKTWNGMTNVDPWMTEANLRRADPRAVINLCGVGPQGRQGKAFEQLSLLPKDCTAHRRKAVWRAFTLDVAFDRHTDAFTLFSDNGDRQSFKGKLWESKDASDWCAKLFADAELPFEEKKAAALVQVKQEQMAVACEDHPLWGMF